MQCFLLRPSTTQTLPNPNLLPEKRIQGKMCHINGILSHRNETDRNTTDSSRSDSTVKASPTKCSYFPSMKSAECCFARTEGCCFAVHFICRN